MPCNAWKGLKHCRRTVSKAFFAKDMLSSIKKASIRMFRWTLDQLHMSSAPGRSMLKRQDSSGDGEMTDLLILLLLATTRHETDKADASQH